MLCMNDDNYLKSVETGSWFHTLIMKVILAYLFQLRMYTQKHNHMSLFQYYCTSLHSYSLLSLTLVVVVMCAGHVIQLICSCSFCVVYLVVNALVAGKFSLVSASSDCTARLWVREKCVKTLQGYLLHTIPYINQFVTTLVHATGFRIHMFHVICQ